ncbi:hypothetical protein MM26B8_02900 [Mycoplasmopsis meleagridis]|uniref:Uncharacterized protein n=1 Tax=Mycoplasmopsis meleagridis ATCC 25294 TaxID=1264554 RepID=A0A0F5H1L0_9BACT|nr:hypothetical protein [Mycoplasmopsis meleagridis]KKB27015.1 hypothetical protein MMELEA_03290 [Mycoplasmopsis meleagridis ATCC 25294]OAD18363.1 hypothetical protein MM26B8_02900 [Mycoplasmopsis meleagridis]VEU77492.1 Uncharacterised protein [Mycoplasmopsis meleagridis]
MNNKKIAQEQKRNPYQAFYNWLFIAIFIILPQAILYIIGTKDLGQILIKPYWLNFFLTYLIGLIALLINILFIYYKFLTLRIVNITVPILCVFWFLIPTSYIESYPLYARLITVIFITLLSALIVNIIVGKIIDYREIKSRKNKNQE